MTVIVYYLSRLENLELLLSSESIKPCDMEYRLKSTKFDTSNEFITLYKCLPKQMDNYFAIKINLGNKANLIAIKNFIFISPKTINLNPKKIEYIVFGNEMKLKKYRGRILITEHIKNAEEYAKKFITSKDKNNSNHDFERIESFNCSNVLFKKEQFLNYEIDARLAYIYYIQLLEPFYLVDKKLDVIVSEYQEIVSIQNKIKHISNVSFLVKKSLEKDSKKLYQKICYQYKQDLTKNIYHTNKNTFNLNIENIDSKNYKQLNKTDKKLIRLIISNYNQSITIKQLLSNIGKELKDLNFNISIINDFRIIYNVTINANFSKSIKNINNLILKCFFVSVFKKDNIVEFRDLCKLNSIDKFVYPYLFLSYLKPYSEMSRSYKEHVDSNSLLKNLLFIEINYLRSLKENFYNNELKK